VGEMGCFPSQFLGSKVEANRVAVSSMDVAQGVSMFS